MATAYAAPRLSGTPWVGRRRTSIGVSSQEVEQTPLAMGAIAPSLRDGLIAFNQVEEGAATIDSIRFIVRSDSAVPITASACLSGAMYVLTVGGEDLHPDLSHPLVVFEQIRGELGITQKDLLNVTRIKRRTYYSWKNPATPLPRPSSLGRLWDLADVLVDLREALDGRPLAAWLHAAPERITAFHSGHFEDLVELAVDMPKSGRHSLGTSKRSGIAAEADVPVVRSAKAPEISLDEVRHER